MASDVKCDKCGNSFPLKSVLLGYAVETKSNCYICSSCNEAQKKEVIEESEDKENSISEQQSSLFRRISEYYRSKIKSDHVRAACVCNLLGLLTCWVFGVGLIFSSIALILSVIAMNKDYIMEGVVSCFITMLLSIFISIIAYLSTFVFILSFLFSYFSEGYTAPY